MKKPKVSVIVPIYNVEPYLKQCIDSIRNQTMTDIEIILIDDGSTDRCPQMCDKYAAEDSRIHVIHQKNAGVSVARNDGIKLAKADWIMFVDPDDWLEIKAVEILYEAAIKVDDDIVCASFYREYVSRQEKTRVDNILTKEYIVEQELGLLLGYVVGYQKQGNKNALGYPWGKLYKKSFLSENQVLFIPGLKRRQDTVFNLYAVYYAKRVFMIDAPIYHYRIYNESACKKIFLDQVDIYHQIHELMYKFMEKFQLGPVFQDLYKYVVLSSIFEFSKLLGGNVYNKSTFSDAVLALSKFCSEDDCRNAIIGTSLTSLPRKRQKLFYWLLKHKMYRATILISCIYRKLFPHK